MNNKHRGSKFVRAKLFVFLIILSLMFVTTLCTFQYTISGSNADNCNFESIKSESTHRNNKDDWTKWTMTTDSDFTNGTITDLSIDGIGNGGQLILEKEGQWINMNPTTKPSPRINHGMGTVLGDDKIMLFGGTDGWMNGELNDTWLYDYSDNQWYLKNPSTKPSARQCFSISAINDSDEIILYGGEVSNVYYHDTWKYNVTLNQWTNMTPVVVPTIEWGQSMAMAYNTDKVVMFGGFYSFGSLGGDETWVYDLSDNNWEQKFPVLNPPKRSYAGMTPIYNTDLILMFGGHDGESSSRKDTWTYNITSNTWTPIYPGYKPKTMSKPALSTIFGDDKVLVFGGNEGTWVFDLSDNAWTMKTPNKNPPQSSKMTNLYGTVKTIHFGGRSIPYDETWSYDINMYESTGEFVPYAFDCSGSSRFKLFNCSVSTPPGTKIEFQIRTGEDEFDLNDRPFVGPDGTTDTFYITPEPEILSAKEGDRWCQYKAIFNTTDFFVTPILHETQISYNVIPELKSLNVNPSSGDVTDLFNFTILYSDFDNDPPEYVKLSIDGINYTMIENNEIMSDYIDGKIYWYKTKLSKGDHTYQVYTSDGDVEVFSYKELLNVDIGPLHHIIVSPSIANITADENHQFSAIGFDLENNIVDFTPKWEINGGGSIDSFGNFTAKKVGTWKVFAKSGVIFGNATITVTGGLLNRILVTPEVSKITTDDHQIFSAQGFDADNNTIELAPKWDVTGGGIIDQDGNYTASKPGLWMIYANSSGISGTATIEVSLGKLAKIIVTPGFSKIGTDDFIEYTAISYDTDMNILPISPVWYSTGRSTITNEGNFTSKFIGEFEIFANFSGISGNASVIVSASAVKTITITPIFTTINVSDSVVFTVKFHDAFNNEVVIESPHWDVSGGGTIDSSGKFIAEHPGIWAIYCNESGISEKAQVKVRKPEENKEEDNNDTVEPKDESETSDNMFYVGVGTIIIIAVVILISLFLFVIKKKPNQDSPSEQVPPSLESERVPERGNESDSDGQ